MLLIISKLINFEEIINYLSKYEIKVLDIVTEDGDLEDVFLYTVDDLGKIVKDGMRNRESAAREFGRKPRPMMWRCCLVVKTVV